MKLITTDPDGFEYIQMSFYNMNLNKYKIFLNQTLSAISFAHDITISILRKCIVKFLVCGTHLIIRVCAHGQAHELSQTLH